tara:strand:- start:107 stop:499 length:393 start_codon:yes stop_codon:yes gene_type:complete
MDEKIKEQDLTGIVALLVHAAKIDEKYTEQEKSMLKSFINSLTDNSNEIDKILSKAENLEENSNQLLEFTNIIKKKDVEFKSKVIKELWKIIISDKKLDEYESNLMRRICGLIYFPDKLSAEIKLQLTNK